MTTRASSSGPAAAGALVAACLRQPLPAADLLTRLAEIAPTAAAILRDATGASPG